MSLRNLLINIGANTSGLNAGINSALANLSRLGNAAQQTGAQISNSFSSPERSLSNLSGQFLSVAAAIVAVKGSLAVVSTFQRLDASLKAVSSSSEDFQRTQTFLRDTSDQLGLSYETLASTYKGLKAATNGTGLEGAKTQKIFLSVVRAGAALKLSNEDIQGSLLALQQMMSKGTVQAEELRGQLGERLPGAFRLMANALGVTQVQLNKMLEQGQVMAEDALPKLAVELEKTFGANAQSNVNTMAGGFTRATDQLKLFIFEFSQSAGIDTFFTRLGNGFANTLSNLRQAKKETGSYLGEIIKYTDSFQADFNRFKGLPLERKQAFISKLEKNILQKEETQARISGFAPTDSNLMQERQLEGEIRAMRGRYNEYRKALVKEIGITRRDSRRASEFAANAPAILFDIDKAKSRQGILEKQIQNFRGNNQSVPKAVQQEYDKLTAQIEKAILSTKKHKDVLKNSKEDSTYLDYAKERLQHFTEAAGVLAAQDKPITPLITKSVVFFTGEVEKAQNAIKAMKPVDLGDKLKEIKLPADQLHKSLEGFVSPLTKLPGLMDRFSEMGNFGTLNYFEDQLQRIQTLIGNMSIKKMSVGISFIGDMASYVKQIRAAKQAQDEAMGAANKTDIQNSPGAFSGKDVGKEWASAAMESLAKNRERVIGSAKDMTMAVQSVLQQGAAGGAAAMGAFIGGLIQGTQGINELPKIILGVFADMLQSLATALAASAAVMLFVPGLQAQAAAQFAGAAGLFAVSGLARGMAKPKETAFAAGATVSGPIRALVGEYPGANNNPEWITPVNKGAGLIAQELAGMGAFGGGGDVLVATVKSDQLDLVLKRGAKNKRLA